MRRSAVRQEIRRMRFEDIYGRYTGGRLGCEEAAELLGMSVSAFYRYRRRYEADGAEGLADRRLGRASARRAPVDELAWVAAMVRTRCWDSTAKHFHEVMVREHGLARGYTWTKLALQRSGLLSKAPRRSAHRKKRPRRPLPGMLLFQDGSRHEWLPGRSPLDLIATMDDATGEVYSAFLVEEEGTGSSFRGLAEVIERRGLFCALYTDRGGHYFHTPEAGGRVDRDRPTQVGRALAQLGIEHIAAYSPEARGRIERLFGTLQNRLPQELRVAGVATVEAANRYLAEVFLPAFNARFAVPAAEPGSAFVPYAGAGLADILCAQTERVVGNDNTVRYRGLSLQIPEHRHRRHFVRVKVRVHEYADGSPAAFHGPRRRGRYSADGAMIDARLAA
jgi:transposase